MADAHDLLQHCPICDRIMQVTLSGLICPPCNYWFCSEEGESILQTCQRYSEAYETIRTDLEKGEEMKNGETTKRALTIDDIDFLESLQEEMLTQDTMCQADPRFWVVRESLDEPCWAEQADHYAIVDGDGNKIGEIDYFEENTGAFTCVPEHRVHRNAPDTLFLTLREAQNHIARNGHNYKADAHPYAMTAWRSPQVEQLYKILQEVDWNQLR